MELHQLECFIAVVEEGGFNRATTRLHKTQPAISYNIKQLEEELGLPLLHRRPRSVTPTEAGRLLFQHAQEIIVMVRQTRQSLERLSEGVVGEVRIGTVNSIGMYFLPEVLRKMREKYPEARPTVVFRNSPEILEALLANQLDLAVVANPAPDRRLRQDTILVEPVSLVCGRSHELWGRLEVRPSDLEGLNFISLTSENPTGQLVRGYLLRVGVDVKPVVSTDNVETVKKMVEVGMGVALLPDMVTSPDVGCMGQPMGQLTRVALGPGLTRRIVLVTWKQHEMTPAVAAFMNELRAHAASWKGCVEDAEE